MNQVENVYDGLGDLVQQYQSVSGMVDTSTTPSVQYVYSQMADGANSDLLTEIIYPDGYTVDYNYGSESDTLDSSISRLSSISDDTGTLQSYQYLGLDTVVVMVEPESDLELTYVSTSDGTGSAGDQYTGLDQFGRVVEQNWYNTSTDSSVVDLVYGYDNNGNVLYEDNTLESSQSELFSYDGLGQITSYEQGTLSDDNTEIASPSTSETWTYDPLGNHTSDTTNGTEVTSTFNYDNQITSMSGYTTPAYDADGNMTTDQSGLKYVYNAWGEEVTVKNSSDTTLESYTYDGLGNQMSNTVGSTTTDYYNSTASSGQVLEESVAGVYTTRYVWSPEYVNQMIDRDTDTSGTGLTATGTSYTRLFPLQDANYDTVALENTSGTVVERYSYDPFGSVMYLTGGFAARSESSYEWVYDFQGMREDLTTGLADSGARWYDSALAAWTRPDPSGFYAGSNSLFCFVGNDPIDECDPTGLAETKGDINLPENNPSGYPQTTVKYTADLTGCLPAGSNGQAEINKLRTGLKDALIALQNLLHDLGLFTGNGGVVQGGNTVDINKRVTGAIQKFFGGAMNNGDPSILTIAKKIEKIYLSAYNDFTKKTITIKCDPQCKNKGAAYSEHWTVLGEGFFSKDNTIFLCPGFFDGPLGSTAAGVSHTILHELAHQYGNITEDFYISDPNKLTYSMNHQPAIPTAQQILNNADNYAWLIHSTYFSDPKAAPAPSK